MGLSLNSDICDIIASNFYTIEYELEDWVVKSDKFSYYKLSRNPNAIDFLRKHPEYINYQELSINRNPKAIELLENQFCQANDRSISTTVELIEKYSHRINWSRLSSTSNRSNIRLINHEIGRQYTDKIDWGSLIPLSVDYDILSLDEKPESIAILRENFKKINWYNLCHNKSPEAIQLLKENPEKIIWNVLSTNPSALEILREHQDKINWDLLSSNTNPEILKLFNPRTLMNLSRNYFSSNIGAYEFLKTYPEYITDEIGKMPYIFKPVKKYNDDIKSVINIVLNSSSV
jgi:hypothetical protein